MRLRAAHAAHAAADHKFAGETAAVDGMVKAMAGSPSILPLLTGGNGQDERRARAALDLDVEASGARFRGILDTSGTLIASSDQIDARVASIWPATPWFQKALAGQPDKKVVSSSTISGR